MFARVQLLLLLLLRSRRNPVSTGASGSPHVGISFRFAPSTAALGDAAAKFVKTFELSQSLCSIWANAVEVLMTVKQYDILWQVKKYLDCEHFKNCFDG